MRACLRRCVRSERGFTLVELLVAMTLALVVLGCTFTILDLFNQHYTRSNQRTDAQDRARLALDRIAWEMRNIATEPTATGNGTSTTYSPMLIERATAYDVVFDTVMPYSSLSGAPSFGSNTNQVVRVRYCVPDDTSTGSSSNEALYQEVEYWSSAVPPASPWSTSAGTTVACPDNPLPDNTISTVLVNGVTNRYQQRTDRPVFSYINGSTTANSVDTAGLSAITSVGADLFLNPTPTNASTESEIKSGADLRAVANFPTATFTTTSEGTGKVLLNAEAYSPDNEQLTYSWSCSGSNCPTSSSSSYLNATSPQYEWSPGSGTYTITLVATDDRGLSYASTQTVNVS
jgi:prepilin-type N-terminal cleavage/methylation domain-containing protein